MRPNPIDLFWSKVDRSGDCWRWTGAQYQGYGRLTRDQRTISAHRYSWQIANGAIPAGLEVCHRCDNPSCVRPSHLFLATHAANIADMMSKGRVATGDRSSSRARRDCRPRGERHPSHRLTEEDVRTIRREVADGSATKAALSRRYGVHFEAIRRIVIRRTWAWLEDA